MRFGKIQLTVKSPRSLGIAKSRKGLFARSADNSKFQGHKGLKVESQARKIRQKERRRDT